jgi:DNA polymerase I-like protein with 3'-5' exonuclease and polymerase domains
MVVDRERYWELESQLLVELKETEERALQLIPGRIRMKYADDLKISRPALVTDFMFGPIGLKLKPRMTTAKNGDPSTAIEHLEMFDHPEAVEFVSAYRQWQSAKKTMSTYVTGFLVHLREDGRFHPSYMLHRGAYGEKDTESGTVTGRTSAKDPAYQTIPKHTKWAKPLRSVYVAPPGYAVLNADYSQGELRITACVANEPTMIALYRRGEDLHLATGAEANAMTLEQAKALSAEERGAVRQGGKAGNFGLIYGMMEDGFVEYARSTYHVDLTHAQATAFRNRFFAKYKRLPVWHTETRAIARKHKMVRSPLGRIRRLPMIDSWAQDVRSKQERQAINSQIQSTLSDMGLLAIALLYERYPELWVFGFTHDAISCYVPEDAVTEWALRIREVMETLPLQSFGWRPQLPFPVDVEVGARMDSMKTLDLPR